MLRLYKHTNSQPFFPCISETLNLTFFTKSKMCLTKMCLIYIYIYIYYPLYTNWSITNADLPHVIIQYILYFIYQKLYWTVSGQLSNIEYIGQFQNEATGTLRTRYRRTKAVSMYLYIILLSIFPHLRKYWYIYISHRLIFIVNNIFNIGWLTVQYRLYWTQISYIGLGCASSNIAFFVQCNLY